VNRHDARWVPIVTIGTILAWAGFCVHNVAELPGQTIISPETRLPTLIWSAALILWLIPVTRTAGAWTLLAWALFNVIGGSASVLPFPFLPFDPAQTVQHYAFHGLYAATQVPLIVATALWLRRRADDRPHDRPHGGARASQQGRSGA
jgi:hypothetical protein